MRYITYIFIIVFFSACFHNPSIPLKTKQQTKTIKPNKVSHGLIKAKILSQAKQNNSYKYTIKILDTNENISFLYHKKLYNPSDIIYVDLDKNSKFAKSLYLSKQKFQPDFNFSHKKPHHKRTKNRKVPWIGVPKTQNINLF